MFDLGYVETMTKDLYWFEESIFLRHGFKVEISLTIRGEPKAANRSASLWLYQSNPKACDFISLRRMEDEYGGEGWDSRHDYGLEVEEEIVALCYRPVIDGASPCDPEEIVDLVLADGRYVVSKRAKDVGWTDGISGWRKAKFPSFINTKRE